MKAKLIKIDYQFFLYDNEDNLIATTENSPYKRLSLKNCQAIERGYDLDELAKEAYKKHSVKDDKLSLDEQIQRSGGFHVGYKEGAKAILELLGDKKFTEEDMGIMMEETILWLTGKTGIGSGEFFDKTIQSLQKTEWDVTFNPEEFDADGCLILR